MVTAWAFLPRHHHCPSQLVLSLALKDVPSELARVGLLIPTALTMPALGGQDAHSALLGLQDMEPLITPEGCLVMTDRATHTGPVTRYLIMDQDLCLHWLGPTGSCDCGPGPVLTIQGQMLQPENSNQVPSLASLADTHTQGTCGVLLCPMVILGPRQQFQENGVGEEWS